MQRSPARVSARCTEVTICAPSRERACRRPGYRAAMPDMAPGEGRARSEYGRLGFGCARSFVETLGPECGEVQGGRAVDQPLTQKLADDRRVHEPVTGEARGGPDPRDRYVGTDECMLV